MHIHVLDQKRITLCQPAGSVPGGDPEGWTRSPSASASAGVPGPAPTPGVPLAAWPHRRRSGGRASRAGPHRDGWRPSRGRSGGEGAGERRLVQGRQPAEIALAYFPRGARRRRSEYWVVRRPTPAVPRRTAGSPPGWPVQGVAKAGRGGRFVSLAGHIRCIYRLSAVVKGGDGDNVAK